MKKTIKKNLVILGGLVILLIVFSILSTKKENKKTNKEEVAKKTIVKNIKDKKDVSNNPFAKEQEMKPDVKYRELYYYKDDKREEEAKQRLKQGGSHIKTAIDYKVMMEMLLTADIELDKVPDEFFYDYQLTTDYSLKNRNKKEAKKLLDNSKKRSLENFSQIRNHFLETRKKWRLPNFKPETKWEKMEVSEDITRYKVWYENELREKEEFFEFELTKVKDTFNLFPDLDYIIVPYFFTYEENEI